MTCLATARCLPQAQQAFEPSSRSSRIAIWVSTRQLHLYRADPKLTFCLIVFRLLLDALSFLLALVSILLLDSSDSASSDDLLL